MNENADPIVIGLACALLLASCALFVAARREVRVKSQWWVALLALQLVLAVAVVAANVTN